MRVAIAVLLLVVVVVVGGALLDDDGGSDDSSADVGGTDESSLVCPDGAEDGLNTAELVGLSVPEAKDVAAGADCTVRVVERDGEPLPADLAFFPERVNVATVDGEITEVINIG